MLIPEKQRRFCPKCNAHTIHKVKEAKRKPRKSSSRSQRRFMRKLRGYGSFPRENPKGREKPTRKLDLRYECSECKKINIVGKGFRVKKFEFVKSQEK